MSYGHIRSEGSREARERALGRKLRNLRDERRVEAADNTRRASWVSNDPKFGALTVDPSGLDF